ncbi:hypothetical protein [Roseomonas marmotae]|uniref:Porin n=1 Tax=Roseomonas marmotae TaxID=2768161 RepID=A0ABS3KGH4_9PROT|nr:hypothetical protein [Roseomonas marmotae]MBO1075738.1 hypothetical protein [Roseomonas marmotae]QTI80468.1 hypothetical protein IAI58_06930 [Roseomonas marmotae]
MLALLILLWSPGAMARGEQQGDLSLSAVVGGALPYSTGKGSYLVTRLISPGHNGRPINLTGQSPFGRDLRNAFDVRPQIGLGGRYVLGEGPGGAKLALRVLVSAGMNRPEGTRSIVGIAGLTVLF